MQITVNLPDELALRLQNYQQQLPEILELGLREFNANAQMGFEGMAEVLEFLAQLPTPEEIIALRPSQKLQAQIDRLLGIGFHNTSQCHNDNQTYGNHS